MRVAVVLSHWCVCALLQQPRRRPEASKKDWSHLALGAHVEEGSPLQPPSQARPMFEVHEEYDRVRMGVVLGCQKGCEGAQAKLPCSLLPCEGRSCRQ